MRGEYDDTDVTCMCGHSINHHRWTGCCAADTPLAVCACVRKPAAVALDFAAATRDARLDAVGFLILELESAALARGAVAPSVQKLLDRFRAALVATPADAASAAAVEGGPR